MIKKKINNLNINLNITKKSGWKNIKKKNIEIYFKGFFLGNNLNEENSLHFFLANFIKGYKINYKKLSNMPGNFVFIAIIKSEIHVAMDASRSNPLYYYFENKKLFISEKAKDIKKYFNIKEINEEISILAKMSGYTFSNYTLYSKIYTLNPGEFLRIDKDRNSLIKKYIKYFPKKIIKKSYKKYEEIYFKTLLLIFKDYKKHLENKDIYIALSAGDDSRLIVSMLKILNFKNVKCFSYGTRNNWESKISKKISNKLGYEWFFIEIKKASVNNFFKSKKFARYFELYDNYDSTPSIHELAVFDEIKKKIPKNSVIINGQPADGIYGSYVYKNFVQKETKYEFPFNDIIDKHYSLWENLKTNKNINVIKKYLKIEKNKFFQNQKTKAYKIMMVTSLQNRICKYLNKNYEVYEFYNYKWICPFMDLRFLKFWFSIPEEYLLNRNLSKKILKNLNIANVWNESKKKDNNLGFFAELLRNVLKVFFINNRKEWEKFHKKYFAYDYDNQLKTHIVSEKDWKKSKYHRSSISFLSLKWLKLNKINEDYSLKR
jgi:asparagine synthase (glutamine-hydrolysing)